MEFTYTVEIEGEEIIGTVELYPLTEISGYNGDFDSFIGWEVTDFKDSDNKTNDSAIDYLNEDGYNDLLAYIEELDCAI